MSKQLASTVLISNIVTDLRDTLSNEGNNLKLVGFRESEDDPNPIVIGIVVGPKAYDFENQLREWFKSKAVEWKKNI